MGEQHLAPTSAEATGGGARVLGRRVPLRQSGAGATPASPRANASRRAGPSRTQQPFSCLTLPALFPAPDAARLSRSNGDGPGAPFHHALNRTIIAAPARAKQLSPNASPELLHCRQGNAPR